MSKGDSIEIRDLRVHCMIGVRPEEREREQPVRVDLELGLDLREAGRTGRISKTCDYDRVVAEVEALLRFRRFRLIEAAVEEVSAMLLGVHAPLGSVTVRLEKPEALGGRGMAAVRVERTAKDFPKRCEAAQFGDVEVLLETKEAGLYLLHVDPSKSIPRHHHKVMRELEWLVAGELFRGGQRVSRVEPIVWSHGEVHDYENRGSARATLFCCDCPPFIRTDEIEVET